MSPRARLCALAVLVPLSQAIASGTASYTLPAMWQVKLDHQDTGVNESWFAPDMDEAGWQPISTHRWAGWETQGLPEHIGVAWYRVQTSIPTSMRRKQAYLYFSAVDEEAWVWVNGRAVGEHTAASEGVPAAELWQKPFFLDVTQEVRFEQPLSIAVRVRNRAQMGGIWQPVHLLFSDEPLTPGAMKERAAALNKEILDAGRGDVRYEAWSGYAYDPVLPTSKYEGERSAPGTPFGSWAHSLAEAVRVRGASGEIVPFALNVRNLGAGVLPIRLDLERVVHAERDHFMLSGDRVDVHLVDYVITRARDLVPDPLPRTDGAASIRIPAQETRSFFVAIDTRGLPAGRWHGHVRLTPLRAGPTLRIPFELLVAPVALPDRAPLRVALWTYDPRWFCASHGRGGERPYVELMRRTGVNTVITRLYGLIRPIIEDDAVVGINAVDFDAMLARHGFGDDDYLVFGALPKSMSALWGGAFLDERWGRNFIAYLRLVVRHIQENHGIRRERWALYLMDEHIGDHFVALGRLTRAADPAIRIWANRVEDLATMTKAEPYIDIFVPVRWNLSLHGVAGAGRFPESERLMRDKGKEWWMYAHSGWQPPDRMAVPRSDPHAPHRRLRMDGWMAWRLGLKGIGYWIYAGKWWGRYSGFDDRERANTAFVYLGPDGPVTSRRLEAYREGIEDHKLLWVLDRAAAMAGQDPALVRTARSHVTTALTELLPTPLHERTGEALLRWRKVLLDDAARLCAALPLDVKVAHIATTPDGALLQLAASKPVRVWTWVRPGGVRPSDEGRFWTFVGRAHARGPRSSPTITVEGLVPGQPCAVTFVIAGPEGQQRVLAAEFETEDWPRH